MDTKQDISVEVPVYISLSGNKKLFDDKLVEVMDALKEGLETTLSDVQDSIINTMDDVKFDVEVVEIAIPDCSTDHVVSTNTHN